jgi:3-deoxy-7-phosphoheptulonate synthase
MIIVMKKEASSQDIEEVIQRVEETDHKAYLSHSMEGTLIGTTGEGRPLSSDSVALWPGVERAVPVLKPFKLASRDLHPEHTEVDVGGVKVGGREIVVMAGPCAVESAEQILEVAQVVKRNGAKVLRGGAFKPRTSPYAFQGLGEAGLRLLSQAREKHGCLVVTEVLSPEDVDLVARYADILQIGARNMQNSSLLHAVGETRHAVLLKRGMSSTIEELLMAAEYILSRGNQRVILCERGIRTFESYTRNTFDVSAIPALKSLTHLPVIADPSHATGRWELVAAVARAAIAAGADGLMIEVHPHPEEALSDGAQSLTPERFRCLMQELRPVVEAVGRTL